MDTPVLEMCGLVVGYSRGRRRKAVSAALTGSLPAASLTALMGTNGVGKSTLLRTLAGLQPALSGEVRWMGRPLSAYTPAALARTVSVVLTDRFAGEGLTACDVAAMGRLPHTGFAGRMSAHDRDVVAQALAEAGCAAYARRSIDSLSDGERARVMIAKALAQQTPVILLDEPTAFLDFPARVAVLRLLQTLSARHGKTILLSTHDIELTLGAVGHLWLLSSEGLFQGTPQRLAGDGTVNRLFGTADIRFDTCGMRFTLSPDRSHQSRKNTSDL